MSKLNSLFETYLSGIEPDEQAKKYAADAHGYVREKLAQDKEFSGYVDGSFLYGSYKRYTAVGDIKDVDIVILTCYDLADPKNTPQRVLRQLKEALARCYDAPENPEYQRRSIRVNEPLPNRTDVEMTLDIIPAVAINGDDQPLYVPDREVKRWILSHPKGHIERTTRLNKQSHEGKQFVPLVKMMKAWWKYQCETRQPEIERPKPKGFWVECLTAENFDPDQAEWADHFVGVLERVSDKYADIDKVPEVNDPGLPGETIKTSMTLSEFTVFMEAVNESLDTARLARDASDNVKSSELWRDVLGDDFPLFEEEEPEEVIDKSSAFPLKDYSHAKAPLWPMQLDRRYKVRLDAFLYKGEKRLSGINSNGRIISSGLHIRYVAKVRDIAGCEIFWQVVNTGPHAKRDNGLRGEFFKARRKDLLPSSDPLVNWEHSKYTGKHWIQCFVVQNGVCIGMSPKFYVNIKNPDF